MKINGHALIVDDIEVNRLVAYELTCQLGMEATKIASGMEAIELAQKETFDVILMDIQMPIVDGIQATKLIKRVLNNDDFNRFVQRLSGNKKPERVKFWSTMGWGFKKEFDYHFETIQ